MKEVVIHYIFVYLAIMTVIGLAVMGIDKRKAVKNQWRIPERTLLLVAFAGGGIGTFLGMQLFRHKTRHMKFVVLLPLSAMLYVLLGIYLMGMR
jgi:uncharacterized membrane protein YsdA (DUF1294 family)